jgi:hypothetical protein
MKPITCIPFWPFAPGQIFEKTAGEPTGHPTIPEQSFRPSAPETSP